jgi:hypothetical protein
MLVSLSNETNNRKSPQQESGLRTLGRSELHLLSPHYAALIRATLTCYAFRKRRETLRFPALRMLHTYDRPGRYTVAVKVIDVFGNDTMTLLGVNVG